MVVRRAAKIDDNQKEVVKALRKVGAVVRYLSQGEGLPDLLVGYRAQTFLVEVKNINTHSREKGGSLLTPAQKDFHDRWIGGSLLIVHDAEQAIKAITQ